jgi:hypothetical protein
LETLEKIAAALKVPAGELFRPEVILDEHMKLISSRSAEEIALITKITRDVIWGMGMKS